MPVEGAHLGIDVGGSSVRIMFEGAEGQRSEVVSAPSPDSYRGFLVLVEQMARELVQAPVAAVGCGLPGSSDSDQVLFVPALPWMVGHPLRRDLESLLGARVILGLDGHFTLLAEATEGAAKGYASCALVAVGTGIGGAIMLAHKIWRGARGSAGSVGWLSAVGGRDDADHGLFEQVASGTALSQAARAYRPGWAGENLVAAARAGDAGAVAVADQFGRHFGRGIAALASVLDPELVIVAGGLCDAMDVLSPSIDRAMLECASPNGRQVPVRAAALGPHAGVVGALLATTFDKEIWL